MADLIITAADVRVQSLSPARAVQYGEAVTPGQVVYRSTADNKYYLADCDLTTTSTAAGIVLTNASADDYGYLFDSTNATIDLSVTLTEGTTYVVSDTAGNIMPDTDLTTGQYLSILGYSVSGNLRWQPNDTGLAKP